jgi:peptidoglycan/xylan/chitin deacetylase (PgdA/CDA1 family)
MGIQNLLKTGNVGVGRRRWVVLSLGLLASVATRAALAEDCPGHPDALGTSRTLVVDPKAHPRIGTMQYPETLPLQDHEVVLTFDDGPLPRNSNQVLDILAAQCVKATFFTIGKMAQAYPQGVRKLRDAGHSIGTHTQDHPLTMNKMAIERAQQEIDDGIASVKAALGDDAALAPFFRIPGLLRAEGVENYLASQGLQVWSADFLADDWRHISASRVYELAIKRLEQKGRGILLLHDIQARTVAALPRILNEMKARGYRIVHVVPASPERPATPTEPQQWQLHPPTETVAISHWPKIPSFVFADAGALAAPSLSDLDWRDERSPTLAELLDHDRIGRGVPRPQQAPWPRQWPLPADSSDIALPVPAENIFEIPEKSLAVIAMASHREEATGVADREIDRDAKPNAADTSESRRLRGHSRHARRSGKAHIAHRGSARTARDNPRELKHLAQVRKRSA